MATEVLTTTLVDRTAAYTVSGIRINEAQARVEVTPTDLIEPPQARGAFEVDENVRKALPTPGSVVVKCLSYGESLWGKTAKITVQLPDGQMENYFLKVVSLGDTGRIMCQGEFESLTAIDEATPGFCPKPHAWGRYSKEEPETHFILEEFREIRKQPADPAKLAESLARLHLRSESPTGKFGFHTRTCHARIAQAVDVWDDSWCVVFKRHIGYIIDLAKPILDWPEFDVVADLLLEKVVPRLLLPLQSDGRVLKPCLVHGDCWDGNTAMDMNTGEAFIFDVCSFYGHNEYDTGNWRAPRHRLSDKAYIKNYKLNFHVSEPEEDWDARNLLYSLPFNIGNTIYIAGSNQRPVIYEDMTTLCNMFCADELKERMRELKKSQLAEDETPENQAVDAEGQSGAELKATEHGGNSDDEEEEEEEEEEEQPCD